MRRLTHIRAARLTVVTVALLIIYLIGLVQPLSAQSVSYLVLEIERGPINLYDRPGIGARVLRTLGTGNRFLWSGARQIANDGRQWMPVVLSDGSTVWATPDDQTVFTADPTHITPGIDRSAIVVPATNRMTLYATPGRGSARVATLEIGTQLRVVDGPVVTDMYTWWPVQIVGTNTRGWVVDTGRELSVLQTLRVYGYQVCDNFDLKKFGAVGWDSVRGTFPAIYGPGEQIVCLASTKMRGDTAPIVVVLSRTTTPSQPQDVLRIFEQRAGRWNVIYQQVTQPFSRTDRMSLHDFGMGKPMLLWTVRNDGTGQVMVVNMLSYGSGGIASILTGEYYKGSVQVGTDGITFIEADYLPGEPNCCPSGIRRVSYAWTGVAFALVTDEKLPLPYAFQSARR